MRYWNMMLQEKTADIYIYGDITSYPLMESDVSSFPLVQEIDALDVEEIRVYINSYGGEIKEGLAICNALNRHKAKIITVCDGFACSAASNIFMAGDERRMNEASLLFIHNGWTIAAGDANAMRKAADEIEKMTGVAVGWYADKLKIDRSQLQRMLDEETFLAPDEAMEMGFATQIVKSASPDSPSQSARKTVMQKIRQKPSQSVQLKIADMPELEQRLDALLDMLKTNQKRETIHDELTTNYRQRMQKLLKKSEE